MKLINTGLEGLIIVEFNIFNDDRGFFCERFNEQKFKELGLPSNFVQDNHSRSKVGVVRGLHYQKNPNQAKLVGCVSGKILDVAVDIRKNSKTFGKYFSIKLSEDNGKMLYIPAGFAHGFSVIGEKEAHVIYKVDGLYNPAGEGGIKFDDKDLNIDWQVQSPIFSNRDLALQTFEEYKQNPVF